MSPSVLHDRRCGIPLLLSLLISRGLSALFPLPLLAAGIWDLYRLFHGDPHPKLPVDPVEGPLMLVVGSIALAWGIVLTLVALGAWLGGLWGLIVLALVCALHCAGETWILLQRSPAPDSPLWPTAWFALVLCAGCALYASTGIGGRGRGHTPSGFPVVPLKR